MRSAPAPASCRPPRRGGRRHANAAATVPSSLPPAPRGCLRIAGRTPPPVRETMVRTTVKPEYPPVELVSRSISAGAAAEHRQQQVAAPGREAAGRARRRPARAAAFQRGAGGYAHLPAPMRKRIAISRSRAWPGRAAGWRRLPQAIGSSTPTIASKTISGAERSLAQRRDAAGRGAVSTMRSLADGRAVLVSARREPAQWPHAGERRSAPTPLPARGAGVGTRDEDRAATRSPPAVATACVLSAASDVLALNAYRIVGLPSSAAPRLGVAERRRSGRRIPARPRRRS